MKNYLGNFKNNLEKHHVKCRYCGKTFYTASDSKACSRKACKHNRKTISHDGMQDCISYDEQLIERRLL